VITRRKLIAGLGVGTGGLLLGACDRLGQSPRFQSLLDLGEKLTYRVQRGMTARTAMAAEFNEADMSPVFRSNGNTMPRSADYVQHLASNFRDWRLVINGLVGNPLALSLAELQSMPTRTQITRHDCVEGWSAIGKWHGVPLGMLLKQARLSSQARYLVFHCADDFSGTNYYESIDLIDAFHAQTILAWGLNDQALPVANGAPLRLRVERQLGYKHAKYVMGVEAVDSLRGFGLGKGGYWEDQVNYEWYAGI
jgi:DMSO/TMAO reductase YedYZ molybdopterin-dependent catalytic subunit